MANGSETTLVHVHAVTGGFKDLVTPADYEAFIRKKFKGATGGLM